MAQKKKQAEVARINRDDFPSVDVLSALNEGNKRGLKAKLKSGYKKINRAQEELRLLDPKTKDRMAKILEKASNDLTHVDEEQADETTMHRISRRFQTTAKSIGDLFSTSLKGAGKFIDSGSDMAFLLSRYYQYRSALLSFVTLTDPIRKQKETLESAILIYTDDSKKTYSCRVHSSFPLDNIVKGLEITEDPETGTGKAFTSLAQTLYTGKRGMIERKNVYKVSAISGAGLEAKHVLAKAASIFRAMHEK